MSAVFKNAKRKQSQLELRKFMNEHKHKHKAVPKIESPLAKYTETGQLTCILCNTAVRSETVWKVHINAKQHRDNIALAKKLKEDTNNFTTPKRPLSPVDSSASKRVKGILKNSKSNIPEDFFDSNKVNQSVESTSRVQENGNPVEESSSKVVSEEKLANETLPEGFFDDPKLDAKARNLEYKDPIEEEWERFQKEIKEVDNKSAEIIAEDQEEATTERQIDEIEEQMRNWSRVMDLERKKEDVKVNAAEEEKMEMDETSSGEEDFDEFLDWRAKRSFR